MTREGDGEGFPALPNTGKLVQANDNGAFTTLVEGLDRPTAMEVIGNTAYIVTLPGAIWKVDGLRGR